VATETIVADAKGANLMFRRLARAERGCLLVYGDYKDALGRRRQGHVAICTEARYVGPLLVSLRGIDCSVSNDEWGDAIQERSLLKLFGPGNRRAIYAALAEDCE